MSENTKEPAAVGAATGTKKGSCSGGPYTYDYTSERQFCQALLTTICELADDIIADESTDAEVAGYAGKIGGLAMAIREVFTNNGR